MKPFRARGADVVARLEPAEATVVGLLLDQLEQLLAADADDVGDDPVLARLLPDGHRGDPEIAADYRELTESALRSGKADDLAVVRATLPAEGGDVRLDADQAAIELPKLSYFKSRSLDGSGMDLNLCALHDNLHVNPVGRRQGWIHRIFELLRELLPQPRPVVVGH